MLLAAGAALFGFAWIAYSVQHGQTKSFDASIRQMIHSWTTPFLTWIMFAATFVGTTGFMAVIAAIFVWWLIESERRRDAILLAGGFAGADMLMRILKLVFHRPRPEPFFGLLPPESFSFPSGHALMSTVFYILLAMLVSGKSGIRAAAAALAFLIGLSRIYLGVHYPSDVLAGFAMGVAWLAGCRFVRTTYADARPQNAPLSG